MDDWQDAVEERLAELHKDGRPVTLAVLYERVGLELKERRNDGRLPAILRRLGYEPGRARVGTDGKLVEAGGKQIRAWLLKEEPPKPTAKVITLDGNAYDASRVK